jgi:hypothetical protein
MYPDFLCIGTPKSGTTWLDHQLRCHPALWLPPIKELHHFDCLGTAPWALYYRFDKGIQHNLRRAAKQSISDIRAGNSNIRWYLRYFCLTRSDAWYGTLFTPTRGQVAGEITPAYCRLEELQVAHIHRLMPHLKVVLILRNPVERFWSNLAMYFSKYGYNGIENVSETDIIKMFDSGIHRRSAEYHKTIKLWRRYYAEDQMLIAFFEQISSQPQALLESVYRFLGVPHCDVFDDKLAQKVNHRQYPSIPDHLKIQLHMLFQTEIQLIHQMFNNQFTQGWLDDNQSVLARHCAE